MYIRFPNAYCSVLQIFNWRVIFYVAHRVFFFLVVLTSYSIRLPTAGVVQNDIHAVLWLTWPLESLPRLGAVPCCACLRYWTCTMICSLSTSCSFWMETIPSFFPWFSLRHRMKRPKEMSVSYHACENALAAAVLPCFLVFGGAFLLRFLVTFFT